MDGRHGEEGYPSPTAISTVTALDCNSSNPWLVSWIYGVLVSGKENYFSLWASLYSQEVNYFRKLYPWLLTSAWWYKCQRLIMDIKKTTPSKNPSLSILLSIKICWTPWLVLTTLMRLLYTYTHMYILICYLHPYRYTCMHIQNVYVHVYSVTLLWVIQSWNLIHL